MLGERGAWPGAVRPSLQTGVTSNVSRDGLDARRKVSALELPLATPHSRSFHFPICRASAWRAAKNRGASTPS